MAKQLREAASCVFVAYNGLSVTDMEELRDQLYEQGARLRVFPKRLFRLVLKSINLDFDPTQIAGQIAVAWGGDVITPAKVLHEFAKTRADAIRLVGGAMEGALLSQTHVMALAQLLGKDQVRSQLVSVLTGPLRGLVMTLSGVQRNFVCALQALVDKKATS